MSLIGFQRAFADLISSPQQCLAVRHDAGRVLAAYDLTDRERRRLIEMVNDPSMSVNCTLYRVNRLTPLYSVMPLTCRLLGERLQSELDAFWGPIQDATLQYGTEARRFADWLLRRIESGALPGGPVEDAIQFELAAYEVRTAPREALDAEAGDPRQRLLRFRHRVESVLAGDNAAELMEGTLSDEQWVLLDATGDALEVRRVTVS